VLMMNSAEIFDPTSVLDRKETVLKIITFENFKASFIYCWIFSKDVFLKYMIRAFCNNA
jgi:hypothetical protein